RQPPRPLARPRAASRRVLRAIGGRIEAMATHESADLQAALNGDLGGIPFRTELSLKPVIDFWTRMAGQDSPKGAVARAIADQVAKVSELLAPLTDCTVVERHAELLDVLMAAAIPPASRDHAYAAAMVPFQLHGFYATPPMERLLMTEDWRLKGRINLDARSEEHTSELQSPDHLVC